MGNHRSIAARPEVLLFLGLWLLYGLLINSDNLQQFTLQQSGVEAIVERRHFYLEGSPTPQLQPAGDTLSYRGHIYANKQPGQFMAGALVYFFLHALGLSYLKNYLLASAMVTFFTGSMLTAAAAVVVFRLAQDLDDRKSSLWWAMLVALVFALATTALPYSGIAHHDAMASAYSAIAFYLVFSLSRNRLSAGSRTLTTAIAGFFLGLTITTSMLPFFMAFVIGAYFLSLREWRLVPFFLLGGILGLGPLLAYQGMNFGNPFLPAYVVGNYSDTFFRLDWSNFLEKLRFYGKFVTLYVPVFWLGFIGLLFLPGKHQRDRFVLFSLLAVLAAYILNVPTVGGCQYGPRFLLPAMPYVSVGLVGFRHLSSTRLKFAVGLIVVLTCLFSVTVNLVGAVYGAMYCDLDRYAFSQYLTAIQHGEARSFPLVPWLLIPMVGYCLLLLVWNQTKRG